MTSFCAFVAVLFRFFSHADARPLAYPEGIKPGDQISGNAGEFWRYKHVLVKPPDDEDRMEALKMSEDVKCDVCETILHRLMKRAESNAEDHIMDTLDGEPTEESETTGDEQEDRVNRNKRGCNKHFKDEVLLRGYVVKKCPAATVTIVDDNEPTSKEPSKPRSFCLESTSNPDSRAADTYSTHSEAIFYSCENTIARYGHEIASFLADSLESGGNVTGAIKEACVQAALCDGAREKKPLKQRKASKEKQSKKKSKDKAEGEEASYMDIMNEQREEERKSRKKRRRKRKAHTEL